MELETFFNPQGGIDYVILRTDKIEDIELVRAKLNGTAPAKPTPEHLTSEALKTPAVKAEIVVPAEEPKPAKPKRAPKMPEPLNKGMDVVSDPAEISDPMDHLKVAGTPSETMAMVAKVEAATVVQTEIEITDADLTDAVTKLQERIKNPVAIRKLINECGVKSPPGRLIEIVQDKRQKFLDGLKEIKPQA